MPRVVITGIGAVSPLGLNAQDSWSALIQGRSGVGPISLFDHTDYEVHLAAEVKDFDPRALLGVRAARRLDRFEQFASLAAKEALSQSGYPLESADPYQVGLAVSSAFGGLASMNAEMLTLASEGPRRVDPLGLTKFMTTTPSISIAHGLRGPSFSVASACASGADGIGLAYLQIRHGVVQAMLAGGADAAVAPLGVASFDRMRAYSHREEGTPAPFSADRDGLVLGEGAAVLMLESLESARGRGAEILAEVVGYGASTDAEHLTAPPEDGAPAARAIERALIDARMDPSAIDYVSAHGTGTPLNDSAETRALKRALGAHAQAVPVSSIKSMTGHMMAASGALEALACVLAIQEGVIPPTINYQEPDPDCDLDVVPNQARQTAIDVALSNSFGFGGHNAVLILRRFEG